MGFFHPAALGLLGLIPVVVLLYFMKMRRPERRVSAAFLWHRALEQARVDSFFEKLKVNLLLILQVLAVTLLALALARPFLPARGFLPHEAVLVLDRSASMQTRHDGRSRFDEARERALGIVRGARPGTRFMVITATTRARLEIPFTSDREGVLRVLRGLAPADTRTDLRPALLLASSTVRGHDDAQVFLFTDRVNKWGNKWGQSPFFGEKGALSPFISPFIYVPVGAPARNLAIAAFSARHLDGDRFEVFAALANRGGQPEHAYLELRRGAQLLDAREVEVGVGARKSFVFPVTAAAAQDALEARLVAQDDLEADNHAWIVLRTPPHPRVLLVTRGNPFLERALILAPGARVFKVAPEAYRAGGGYAVTVWDGVAPPAEARGSNLVLDPPGGAERVGPFAVSAEAGHPLFRYVDMGLVTVAKARAVAVPPDARVVARGGDVPLIVAGPKTVVVAFDPYRSDFPLSVAYPIFMANALAWLGAGSAATLPEAVRTEEGAGGSYERAGLYRVGGGTLAVNLLDADESDVSPPATPESTAEAARGHVAAFTREFGWELILAVLLVLMLEWRVYHRALR